MSDLPSRKTGLVPPPAQLVRFGATAALLLGILSAGCAAVTNPVADGIPAHRLPPELLGTSRESLKVIPLNLLRQKPPAVYRLEPGDILGIYIEGVLGGDRNQPIPVRAGEGVVQPAIGYPVPVRENGTISLPLITPLHVQGLSISEAEAAVREAYTVKKEILKPDLARIIVTLFQSRTSSVLVVREDSGAGLANTAPIAFGSFVGTTETTPTRRRATGFNLELPAYENDVLNALTRSGGLPGLDARNEVIIYRGSKQGADLPTHQPFPTPCPDLDRLGIALGDQVQAIRIPLRLPPGASFPFTQEDIVLRTGDIVYIPLRDPEFFYTGGLLISGQYPLPRDYDLDVVQAIAFTRGTLVNGGLNSNNFTGTTQVEGIGFPNPSLVSVIRRTPGRGQVTIWVDLNRALQDPRERILIKPNDVVILQSTVGEAVAQYFTHGFFNFNLLGTLIQQADLNATAIVHAP